MYPKEYVCSMETMKDMSKLIKNDVIWSCNRIHK